MKRKEKAPWEKETLLLKLEPSIVFINSIIKIKNPLAKPQISLRIPQKVLGGILLRHPYGQRNNNKGKQIRKYFCG